MLTIEYSPLFKFQFLPFSLCEHGLVQHILVNKNGMLYMEVSACIGQPFCSNHVFIIQIGLCEYDFF